MSAKTYVFTTVNKGDVTVSISGEYYDGSVDVDVDINGDDYREWSEVDAGSVFEIFEWMLDKGVEFESYRSMWFNAHYVEDIMIDLTKTESELLDEAANMTDEELKKWHGWFED